MPYEIKDMAGYNFVLHSFFDSFNSYLALMKETYRIIQTILIIIIHKFWVFVYLLKVCFILLRRGMVHDLSKFGKDEFSILVENIHFFRTIPYATNDYEKYIKTIYSATEHHYGKNSHHPQHYGNIEEMGFLDLVEMLCDWKAATRKCRHDNIEKSMEYNKNKFHFSDAFNVKLQQLAREMRIL